MGWGRLMHRFFAVLFVVACSAQTPPVRIKVDIDRTIGEVDPKIFGNFAEHLGRMIYGGIYDEGNPLSDKDGFRTDVMDAVKKLGVSVLRYPGGKFFVRLRLEGRHRTPRHSVRRVRSWPGTIWKAIALARMSF